ncbi:hypothetical protein [Myxococcus sp. RHSTA-1-4]|uniref:hypothetical protein n=1 Tax=Myxococcus sp. RHSTA-1-4 TaxID=2874601 RepID=UPI001CBF5F3D|nr:hypothetical protein [Myxococcus sp. RHSTA-1-4]MBZ4418757.1 hypothetical protein [Myxococcus sp. RHSTA-1-4]
MTATLHIIASCTDRKRQPVPEPLRLRAVKVDGIEARARAWCERLSDDRYDAFEAGALYAGAHWSVVLGLPEVARARGFKPQLWVASAGYGLIPAHAVIRPYSATFARGHDDSVVKNAASRDSADQLRMWWKVLSRHEGPSARHARSINELAAEGPRASILVVASPLYVTALAEDLARAVQQLVVPERLLIVSTPSPLAKGPLAPHWIPSSAHHQKRLGGSKLSLHARVAREIIEQTPSERFDAHSVRRKYQRLIARSAPPLVHQRTPMSDAEVHSFIRDALRAGEKSWSASLRRLRAGGQACEQSRFKRLFLEVREGP